MEAENSRKRHVAYKLSIKDILNFEYLKTDGSGPNYLKADNKQIARVSVIGVVIYELSTGNSKVVVIEDGTGKISARSFEDSLLLGNFSVGDVLLVIGRPREYLGEKYLLIETAKKIPKGWAIVRKLELDMDDACLEENTGAESCEEGRSLHESPKDLVIKKIRELDKGDGVSVDALPGIAENIDDIIAILLREGNIFEVRPGKLKVLE